VAIAAMVFALAISTGVAYAETVDPTPDPTVSGTVELISADTTGGYTNGNSTNSDISADGQYVAFQSDVNAGDLVPGVTDTNEVYDDVFVRDRESGTTELVSEAADLHLGTSLTTTPPVVTPEVTTGNGASLNPSITDDGRFVAFESDATNLVAGDTNGYRDIFVRDLLNDSTIRFSVGLGGQANGDSFRPSIAADEMYVYVAYESYATNLVAGDTNNVMDVFVSFLLKSAFAATVTPSLAVQPVQVPVTVTTKRLSVRTNGSQVNSASGNPSISADGKTVAYESRAWLDSATPIMGRVDGLDRDTKWDIYVTQWSVGTTDVVTTLASVEDGGHTRGSDYDCLNPSISANGQYVVYDSVSPYLVTPNDGYYEWQTQWQIEWQHRKIGRIWVWVPVPVQVQVYVWVLDETTRDVFRTDWAAKQTAKVSVGLYIEPAGVSESATSLANGNSEYASLSGDGRYVVFESEASNLVAGDTNGYRDVFVRDMQTGITYLMSIDLARSVTGAQSGNHSSGNIGPAITATYGDAVPQVSFFSEATSLTQCLDGRVDGAGPQSGFAPFMDWDVFVATLDATPTITSIDPTSGTTAGGTSVIIYGTNFFGTQASTLNVLSIILGHLGVTFDGLDALFTRVSSMKLIVTTPAHAAGPVQVKVTAAGGSAAQADAYTYVAPPVVPPVEIQTVIKRGGHRYEQDDKHILYSGTWTPSDGTGFSAKSEFSTNDKLATITITFKGTRLDWIAALGPLFGKVMVSVDGGTAVEVDLYNATELLQQLAWSTGTLDYGVHVIKIFYPADVDASQIKPINIDALDVYDVLL